MSNQGKHNLKKDSKGMRLLMEIGAWLDDIDYGMHHPAAVLRSGIGGAKYYALAREQASRNRELRRLAERKLIRIQEDATGIQAALTAGGMFEWYRQRVLQCDPFLDIRSSCIVVFDIPESQRALRAQLRRFLKAVGFIRLQQSVWISPFDAEQPLHLFFRAAGASKWVRVFTATESQL